MSETVGTSADRVEISCFADPAVRLVLESAGPLIVVRLDGGAMVRPGQLAAAALTLCCDEERERIVAAITGLIESKRWRPGTEPPDTDLTVMVHVDCDACDWSEPVWIGFHDGEVWRAVGAEEIVVLHWAPMPEGPGKEIEQEKTERTEGTE